MSDSEINYPDVFGYITDVERYHVGPVQVALATRPRNVQAGRQFEVILLIQNATDAKVDVTVSLEAPSKDHEGKKGRFISSTQKLVVSVEPAEVGYALIPMSTMPDTAVGSDYMIGVDIKAKTLSKGKQVRAASGGGFFHIDKVNPANREKIEELKKLRFTSRKRGGLFSGNVLETPVSVLPGKIASPLDLKPGWVSLWTLDAQDDVELLLDKYGEIMRLRVLPALKKEAIYPLMVKKVHETFKKAGYPLKKPEVEAIARLLTLILDFATGKSGATNAGRYDVMTTLKNRERDKAKAQKARLIDDLAVETVLPYWAVGFMRLIAKDERVSHVPVKAIPHFLFDDLLKDAMIYGFKLVERDGGQDLGTEEEMEQFADLIIEKLSKRGEINFSYAYLPLVMAGLIVTDQVLMPDDKLGDIMQELRFLIDERYTEHNEDNDAVFDMATFILEQTLKKYGFLNNR
ncbi:MAG: hypothetical protein D6711_18660 [Chloroflexi bacterium]|nr:MAG: hypothetical protein D6711_18660 [Chloroflexota bacterium]